MSLGNKLRSLNLHRRQKMPRRPAIGRPPGHNMDRYLSADVAGAAGAAGTVTLGTVQGEAPQA